MAVSEVTTYKMLMAWQRVMNENIWRFNQVQGTGVPRVDNMSDAYVQPERDEVARALNNAVERLTDYLQYYPRPTYITGEEIPLRWSSPYQFQTLQTKYKHLIEFGSRATTLISAGAAVTFSDADGDGVTERATIGPIATSVTDTSEIAIFFRTADGAPAAADELWEIEPLTVTISGGNVTITAHRANFVKPSIWAVPYTYDAGNLDTKNLADIGVAGNFVTSVDVYRVYTDTTGAVQLLTDGIWVNCNCSDTSTTTTTAGARITNKPLGIFEVRAATCGCEYPYEAVRVNYRAGLALVRNQIDPTLEEAIVRYANTFFGQMPTPLTERVREKWTYDRDPENREGLTPADVQNPFGIQRGAIHAWRTINNPRFKQGRGAKLTANVRI